MTDRRQDNPPQAPPRDDTGATKPETAGTTPSTGGSAPLAPGSTLGGYRIERVLGVGGMGAVYLATDPKLARRVAVKTMKPELAADPSAKERFLREARATAAVEHEHVVAIFGVGEDGETPYLVMPLLKGESLDDRLRRGPLPLGEACRIAREIAAGLAAAHATGLIHRDVKPSNTWLDPDGRVKLLDFGLARPMAAGENLTALGQVVGTPAYMAPEQARGEAVDARADLFSLGCVLYQLTTGRRPFTGETLLAVLTSLAVDHPPAVDRVKPGVPPELARLIDRLLAKDPAKRPASATDVAGQLMFIEAGLNAGTLRVIPVDATTATGPDWAALTDDGASERRKPPVATKTESLRSSPTRSPRWPLVVAGLAVLLAGAAAAVLYQQVVRVETPKGTLVIESDDPAVEIVVRKGGATILDRTTRREIELAVGDYEIDLAEQKEGLRLSTRRFSITKGEKETVRVRLETPKAPVKPAEPATEPVAPEPAKPPAGPSAFDALDAAVIPKEERFDWQPKELVAVLGSHRGAIPIVDPGPWTVEASPDGRWIVFADLSTGAWLLDAATLRIRFHDPSRTQFARAWSPDGKWLALAADPWPNDPKLSWGVRLVDLSGPEPKAARYVAGLGGNGIRSLAFLPDSKTLVTCTGQGGVYLWDLTGPALTPSRVVRDTSSGWGSRQAVASADGTRIISLDGKEGEADIVRGYDLRPAEPKVAFTLPGKWRYASRFALSADGGTLVVSASDADQKWSATVWDVSGLEPKLIDTKPWVGEFQVGPFAPDGQSFVTFGTDAGVWSLAGGLKKVRDLSRYPRAVTPDLARIVQWEPYGPLRILDREGQVVVEGAAQVASASHGPVVVGDRLATFLDGNLWSVKGRALVPARLEHPQFRLESLHARLMLQAAASPKGQLVAGLGPDVAVRTFYLDESGIRSREDLQSSRSPPVDHFTSFALHPDGKTVLTYRRSGLAELWDLSKTPAEPRPLEAVISVSGQPRLAFSPDGRWLLVRESHRVSAWDLSGPKPVEHRLDTTGDGPIRSAAFSADSRGVFVTDDSRNIVRFDLARKGTPGRLVLENAGQWAVPSPGGGRLAVWDHAVWAGRAWASLKIWDFASQSWVARIHMPDPVWGPHGFSGELPLVWADGGRHLVVRQFGLVYVLRIPEATPDREAAEWVLSLGGTVAGRSDGGPFDTGKGDQLPGGRFRITAAKIVPPRVISKDGRDDFLKMFAAIPELATLDLSGMNLHDRHLPPLYSSASLRSIDLRRNFCTAAGIEKLAAALPKCRITWNRGVIEPK